MTTTTMQTIDRRRRTSDGKAICARCSQVIPEGQVYVEETNCVGNGMVERDYCLDCLTKRQTRDVVSWLMIIAASIGLVAAFALTMVR